MKAAPRRRRLRRISIWQMSHFAQLHGVPSYDTSGEVTSQSHDTIAILYVEHDIMR